MRMSTGSNEGHPPRGPPFPPVPAGGVPPNSPSGPVPLHGLLTPTNALDHYRLTQLYQYAMAAERLRCPPGSFLPPIPPGLRPELAPLFYGSYCRIDPRLAGLCRPPEEPKPQHSYIGLIAMAIMSSPDKKLVLSDIYQYILDNYPYFRTRGPGWRNSIRHNLSLNDCFIKAGRSANGKGHYWAIHPANVDDFAKGDFRRRKAQRKVRRHMGLAVDDEDSPSPPPTSPPPSWHHPHHDLGHPGSGHLAPQHAVPLSCGPPPSSLVDLPATLFGLASAGLGQKSPPSLTHSGLGGHPILSNRKRQFDVASLLAPEKESLRLGTVSPASTNKSDDHDQDNDLSLSSPSPPPSMISPKRLKTIRQQGDETEDEGELIEVAEDSEKHHDDGEVNNDQEVTISSVENSHFQGQDETSSNDEDESPCNGNGIAKRMPDKFVRNSSHGMANNTNAMTAGVVSPFWNPEGANQGHPLVCNPTGHPLLHGPAGLEPLEFLGAQQLLAHGQPFQFNPNQHALLQHNPSLASLMILSSRYREITSNMLNLKRSQQ